METDARYYRRRAREELSGASRAVTQAARERRMHLVLSYVSKLEKLGEPVPSECRRLIEIDAHCGS